MPPARLHLLLASMVLLALGTLRLVQGMDAHGPVDYLLVAMLLNALLVLVFGLHQRLTDLAHLARHHAILAYRRAKANSRANAGTPKATANPAVVAMGLALLGLSALADEGWLDDLKSVFGQDATARMDSPSADASVGGGGSSGDGGGGDGDGGGGGSGDGGGSGCGGCGGGG